MKTQVIDLSQVTLTMAQMIELQRAGVEVKDPKQVTVTASQFKVIDHLFNLTKPVPAAPAAKPVPAAKDAKPVPAAKPAPAAKAIEIYDYSEKCWVVIGNTKPIKDKMHALKGRWNWALTIGEERVPGWIFSKKAVSLETLYETVK